MIKAVLFDFDGVIVDSYDATILAVQSTFKHFNKKIPSKKDFNNLLGLPLYTIIKQLLPKADQNQLDDMHNHFIEEAYKFVKHITLFDNVDLFLKQMAKMHLLAVISNRRKKSLHSLLRKFNLGKYFSSIISREDVTYQKPHPEPLLKTLASLKVHRKHAVYIGDMKEDILAAKRAKVTSIFIPTYNKNSFGADYTVNSLQELFNLLPSL